MKNENCKRCGWKKKCRRQKAVLPDGKTCGDCYRWVWCAAMFGVRMKSDSCVHCPSRFEEGHGDE